MSAPARVPADHPDSPARDVMPGLFAPLNPALPPWGACRVWVIGASTGIGAATSRALLAAGARVALSARNSAALEELAGGSAHALALPADVTDSASIEAAFATICERWGGCDLVLVSAGTHQEIRAWELDPEAAGRLIDTNLMGTIRCCAAVIPTLIARGRGAIGIVSSVAGYRGLPKALVYGASKAALINFAETLYLDLRPRGLGVYLINPGFVKTPLTDRNEFHMPALISAEEAAREIVHGLESRRFEIHFPRRFTRTLKFMAMLPYRLYFTAIRRATGL